MEASSQKYQDKIKQIKTMVKMGQLEESQRQLEELCPNGTEDSETLVLWGRICMSSQKYDDAANIFQRLVDLHPDVATYLNSLGMALLMGGDEEKAMQNIKQAASMAPDSVIFQSNLGKMFIVREQWAEAIKCFEGILIKGAGEKTNNILEMANHCRERLDLPPVGLEHYCSPGDEVEQASGYLEI